MRTNSTGVGIGTTSPAYALQVANGDISVSTDAFGYRLHTSTGEFTGIIVNSDLLRVGDNSGFSGIQFAPGGAEAMRITTAGKVGIGTTVPNQLLSVSGHAWIGTNPSATLPDGNSVNHFLIAGDSTTANTAGEIVAMGTTSNTTTPVGAFEFANYNTGATEKRLGLILGSTDGATNSGFMSFYTTSPGTVSERMRIDHSGNVGIGTTSPTHILHITAQGRSTNSAWATSSDRRVKTNIKPLAEGLDTIMRLKPVTFEYIPEYKAGKAGMDSLQRGFIAQEVEAVVPEMVKTVDEKFSDKEIKDFRLLTNGDFTPLLVSAVKELKAANDNLAANQAKLRADFEAYKAAHK